MKKLILLLSYIFAVFSIVAQNNTSRIINLQKQNVVNKENQLTLTSGNFIINEHFDNIQTLWAKGWKINNLSQPHGYSSWFQGNPISLISYDGADTAYIGANYLTRKIHEFF